MPTILTKKSDTPGSIPATANLTNAAGGAELAVNTADKRLFTITSGSQVVELGTNPASLTCADVSATVLRAGSATITNLLATSLTVSSGSTLNGGVVINEPGADVDFRVESDTDANCLFVDASANNVGIGTSSPISKLQVAGQVRISGLSAGNTALVIPAGDILGDVSSGAFAIGNYGDASSEMRISTRGFTTFRTGATDGTNGTERMRLDSSGNLGLGTASPSTKLTVYDATTPQVTFNNGTSTFIVGNNSGGNNKILYGTGAYPMIFYTNATEAMQIDASQNLGLGVTPSAWQTDVKAIQIGDAGSNICANNAAYSGANNVWINSNSFQNSSVQDIYIRTATAGQYNIQGSTHIWKTAPSGTAGNTISFTQAMTLDASGNLGVGITAPTLNGGGSSKVIHVNAPNAGEWAIAHFTNGSTGTTGSDGLLVGNIGADAYITNYENSPLILATNAVERARITSGGEFLIGTTGLPQANGTLGVSAAANSIRAYATTEGSAAVSVDKSTNTNTSSQVFVQFTINAQTVANGRIVGNGADQVAFASWSDRRLKENIVELPSQWENIKALRPVEFDYIESKGGGHQLGFIAQEVQEVYSDLVSEGEDGMLGLTGLGKNESRLIKALQEAMARIEKLEAEMAALKGA